MDLSSLRQAAASLAASRARADHSRFDPRLQPTDLSSLFARFSALASREAWACAGESLAAAPQGPARTACRRLQQAAWQAAQGRLIAHLDDEREDQERRAAVQHENEAIPFRALLPRVVDEPDRSARASLHAAHSHEAARLDALLARRVAACQELASELGFAHYEALVGHCTGVDVPALAEQATALLAATEDAYRDLMGYALRKLALRVELKPRGEAAAHDLLRAHRLAPLDDVFATRRRLPSAEAFLESVGLSLDAGGRIEIALTERPEGDGRARVFAYEVPDELHLALAPVAGASGFGALYHGLGEAWFLASAAPTAPVEERVLADAAVREAFALAFERVLVDPAFVRRFLDADAHDAQEAARFMAIDALRALREDAARLRYERALYAEGPKEDLKGLYREEMQKALLVEWPVERWLWDVESDLAVVHRLRGAALEAALQQVLLDEANEDYWRNPRTGRLLRSLHDRARPLNAEDFANSLGATATLAAAAERLLAVAAR